MKGSCILKSIRNGRGSFQYSFNNRKIYEIKKLANDNLTYFYENKKDKDGIETLKLYIKALSAELKQLNSIINNI